MLTRHPRTPARSRANLFFNPRPNHCNRHGVESLEPRTLLAALAWSPGVGLPVARGSAAALNSGGSILLFGGSPASGSSAAVLRLDPGATAWAAAPSLDQGRLSPGVGETGQGLVAPESIPSFRPHRHRSVR